MDHSHHHQPRPWEEGDAMATLADLARALPRTRLDRLLADPAAGKSAGVYLMFSGSRNREVVDLLSPVLAHGAFPIYAGCAAHRGWAELCETALIDRNDPLMNRLGGWGAKLPGKRRRTQRSSMVDALFTGRTWTRPPTEVDRIRARAEVVAYLAALDPAGPRWPPLV